MDIKSCLRTYCYVYFLAVALVVIFSGSSSAGTIVVKPGQFDHFIVQLPEKAVAGENFIVKVQAYDLNNNLITNFLESGKEFRVDIGGTASVQPPTLSGTSFSGGAANITINSKKAEKLVFAIREAGGTVPVISREIMVAPNKLEHFVLQAPAAARAGSKFDIRIIAKDLFDNTVDDTEIGRNLKVTTYGTASPAMVGGAGVNFKNGTAMVSFISEKTGASFIELQELTGGSRGRSSEIVINPASLSLFRVQAPKSAVAGEPFDLLVSAYDAYDNLIDNYSSGGSGSVISTNGSTKLEPSSLQPSDFKNGQAVVKAVYEKAEDIVVTVKDVNSDKSGKTTEIQITNAAPDHFVVVTPDSALSGQRFKIKVEAYDRFNNIVKNYNLAGNEVVLTTSGTSFITPSVVLPTEFIGGVAVVDVMYDRAESFTISARMIGEKRQPRMTVTEPQTKRPEPRAEVKQTIAAPKEETRPAVKETPKKPVEKPEIKKAETAKSEPKKTEQKKEQRPAKDEKKVAAAETSHKETEKPVKKTEPKTEKPKQVEKPSEQVKPVAEAPKKEEKKPGAVTVVSKIAAIEARNKAMLVINLSDVQPQFEYRDTIETRAGKEWLKLTLKPVVRKTEKSFKFKSVFVGDVTLEEDRNDPSLLSVNIELLPSGVTFDIERIKNTLIITLSKP